MVAASNQSKHVVVHLDELVLSERLLFFPVFECLGNLLLEVTWLNSVDDLKCEKIYHLR